jgi:drug/metabolite transporter (DMT)-like permease
VNGRAIFGWVVFLLVETAAQVSFKIAGAGLDARHGLGALIVHSAFQPWVLTAFILYFGCFLLWMLILKDADLGRAFPMTALIYLCTLGAAVFLFHEALSPLRVVGIVAIIAGVVLLASDENSARDVESPVHG